MGIDGSFRKRQNPFAQVSNEALHNTELSCKARGLYAIIQSYILEPRLHVHHSRRTPEIPDEQRLQLLHHHGRYGGIADSDYHSVHFYSEILCRKLCFQRRKRLTGKR